MVNKKNKDSNVSIGEKRLLNISEFQIYASIGRNSAFKLSRESGATLQIGRRILVDRVKFDAWCDEQN